MGAVEALARTLDQELLALTRTASLECLVCGEFVLHRSDGTIDCPECGSGLHLDVEAKPAADPARLVC
jgi:uncharacterized Zn finger protein (UPF0148 family)